MKRQPPRTSRCRHDEVGGRRRERARCARPDVLNAKGTTAIDFFQPSLDGRYVAVRFRKTAARTARPRGRHAHRQRSPSRAARAIPHGRRQLAWDEGNGLLLHALSARRRARQEDANFYQQSGSRSGTPASQDTYVIGKEFTPSRRRSSGHARRTLLLASVRNGDGGEVAFYLRGPGGQWTSGRLADMVRSVVLGSTAGSMRCRSSTRRTARSSCCRWTIRGSPMRRC